MAREDIVVGWTLTSKCNLRCKHCYNSSGSAKRFELDGGQAMDIARKLASDSRIVAVNFGGGECALRDDFLTIVDFLANAGIKVSYTTNGSTYQLLADHLDMFNDIGVSMEFVDEAIQNEFRGWNRTYEFIARSLDCFAEAGVDTEVVTCVMSNNIDEENLRGIYEFAGIHGAKHWRLNRYRAAGRGASSNFELTPASLRRVYGLLHDMLSDSTSVTPDPLFSLYGGTFLRSGCPCGSTSFRILENGEVSPCTYLRVSGGNILEQSIDDIMHSRVFKSIRNRMLDEECINCPVHAICEGGCAGAAFCEYGDFNHRDPLCWHSNEQLPQAAATVLENESFSNVHEAYLCTMYVPTDLNWRKCLTNR